MAAAAGQTVYRALRVPLSGRISFILLWIKNIPARHHTLQRVVTHFPRIGASATRLFQIAYFPWMREAINWLFGHSWLPTIDEPLVCRDWLDIEKTIINKNKPTLGAIIWTAHTSSSASVDDLLPCVLDTLDPRETLLQWVEHGWQAIYSALPIHKQASYDHKLGPFGEVIVAKPSDHFGLVFLNKIDSSMASSLALHACQHSPSKTQESEEQEIKHAHMTHIVLRLINEKGSITPQCLPFLTGAATALRPVKFVNTAVILAEQLLDQYHFMFAGSDSPGSITGE